MVTDLLSSLRSIVSPKTQVREKPEELRTWAWTLEKSKKHESYKRFVSLPERLRGHEYESLRIPKSMYQRSLLAFKEESEATGKEPHSLASAEAEREWIATNLTIFHKAMSLQYDLVDKYHRATYGDPKQGFPKGVLYKAKVETSQPVDTGYDYATYAQALMETMFQNEEDFPKLQKNSFPEDFIDRVARVMMRLICRVYMMIFTRCFDEYNRVGSLKELGTCFRHFYFFAKR